MPRRATWSAWCHAALPGVRLVSLQKGAGTEQAWLALNPVPDWRWMLDRSDSPWYPSVRLFRQPRPGPWAPVFEAMAAALAPSLPAR